MRPSHSGRWLVWLVAGLLFASVASAEVTADLQAAFNRRYQEYFGPDSQIALPLAEMDKDAWHRLQEAEPLTLVYREENTAYLRNRYTLTLFRSADQTRFYLEARGGFWGMDERIYGPLTADQLQ